MNMMKTTKILGSYLNSRTDVTQWQITTSNINQREVYLAGEKIEQIRGVENNEFKVLIF